MTDDLDRESSYCLINLTVRGHVCALLLAHRGRPDTRWQRGCGSYPKI